MGLEILVMEKRWGFETFETYLRRSGINVEHKEKVLRVLKLNLDILERF